MTDKSNDPIAMWQKMVGEMEKGFNSFANQAMSSPEFSQAVNRAGGVAAGAQKQLGDLMEKYLVSMNLPSRDQVTGLAERLQSIEGQIGEIKSIYIGKDGKVDSVLVSVGGFLGVDDREVRIAWSDLKISDNGDKVMVNMTKDELKAKPEYRYRNESWRGQVFTDTGPSGTVVASGFSVKIGRAHV